MSKKTRGMGSRLVLPLALGGSALIPAACGNSQFDSQGPFSPAISPHLVLPPSYPPSQICPQIEHISPLLPESSSQIKSAVPICREKKCAQSSVLAMHLCCSFPSPGEFGILIWSDVCTKKPSTLSMILQVPTTQAIRSPYFLSRCFYFCLFFSFVLHKDRFVKKKKKGVEVSAGEKCSPGR